MIAVSLNVGCGVHLIKLAKLYMCTQYTTKHNEDGRMAPGVCGHGSVLLSHSGERRYENWITHNYGSMAGMKYLVFWPLVPLLFGVSL